MNILMTGATGYLGRRLIGLLAGVGHQVAAIKRVTSTVPETIGALSAVRWYDIEHSPVPDILEHYGHIDVILHLATDYGRDRGAPLQPFKVNLALPMSLIDGVLQSGNVAVVNADSFFTAMTDYAYLRSYILSKRQFLQWGRVLAEEGVLQFVNCRIFHMYGPADSDDKFINRLVRQCREHVPSIALTPGTQRRDFVYVDDVVNALLIVVNHLEEIDDGFVHYDVGTGEGLSVRTLAETIHRLTRSRSRLCFGAMPYRQGEPEEMIADNASLRMLGWAPEIDLDHGIRSVVHP